MSRAKDLLEILEAELETEIEKEIEDTDTEMEDEEDFDDEGEDEEDCFEHVLDVSGKSKEWIKELVDKVMDKCPDVTIDHDGDTLTICCYNQEEDQVEEIIGSMNGGKAEPEIKDEDDDSEEEKEEETEIDDNDDEEEENIESEPTQTQDGLVDEAQVHNKRAEEWLKTTKQAGTAPDVFWTDGDFGYSYNTVIAKKEGNKLFLNRTKYSKTTSNLVRAIESSAEDLGMTIINKEEDYFNTSMPIKFGGGADVSRGSIKEEGELDHDMNDTREHTLFKGEPSQPSAPITHNTSESAVRIMDRFMSNHSTTFGEDINENSLKDSSANSLMNYFSK